MKYLALIQGRCGSTRLPNKVLADLAGKPDIQRVVERVSKSKYVDEVMLITSIEKNNLPLVKCCTELGIRVFIGSEDDVLDRYYQAARLIKPEYVIRITADCPMFDWRYLDMAIEQMEKESTIDYIGQFTDSFPDGLDVEIMKYSALQLSWKNANMSSEREHVTQYIRKHPEIFKTRDLECPIPNIGSKRWTLDEDCDYELISSVYDYFIGTGKEYFVTEDVLQFLELHPELESLNSNIMRNEGLKKSLAEDYIMEDVNN